MPPEYDLGQLLKRGVRGKHAKRYVAGTNLVLLDPDVRKAFRSKRRVSEKRDSAPTFQNGSRCRQKERVFQ